jgi:subfamily B ATP-binding cassette protein MsbA
VLLIAVIGSIAIETSCKPPSTCIDTSSIPDANDSHMSAIPCRANLTPMGFATQVGFGGGRLSGGQRPRVTLAHALLRNPRILLLGEATSALDAESEITVQQALARLRAGRTTVVVAPRLSIVRDADLVVAMADGAVVEQGTPAELLTLDGLCARPVKKQALAA